MRFTMPAFRTQAGADSAPRKGTAHATSTLSAVRPHSALSSGIMKKGNISREPPKEGAMEAEPIITKKLGRIGVITLNQPEASNTFTVPFAEQLEQGQRQTFFHRDLS
jgi:hypothetical protein